MTTTDSVLEALLPQLNSDFDRTLLLVIADRFDELAEGSGEGWRVLWEKEKVPAFGAELPCYYWWKAKLQAPDALPSLWFGRIKAKDQKLDTLYYYADFRLPQTAYTVAATEWVSLTPRQKTQCLKELQ